MDQQSLVLVTIALTPMAMWWLVPRSGRSAQALRGAVARSLEAIGAACLFFIGNLAVAVALVLAARRAGLESLSLYMAGDVILLLLSLAQGIMLVAWRQWGSPPR